MAVCFDLGLEEANRYIYLNSSHTELSTPGTTRGSYDQYYTSSKAESAETGLIGDDNTGTLYMARFEHLQSLFLVLRFASAQSQQSAHIGHVLQRL